MPRRRGNHTPPTPQGDSRRLKPPGRFPLRTKVSEFPTYRAIFMSGHDALMLGLLLLPGLALSIAIMGTFAAGG